MAWRSIAVKARFPRRLELLYVSVILLAAASDDNGWILRAFEYIGNKLGKYWILVVYSFLLVMAFEGVPSGIKLIYAFALTLSGFVFEVCLHWNHSKYRNCEVWLLLCFGLGLGKIGCLCLSDPISNWVLGSNTTYYDVMPIWMAWKVQIRNFTATMNKIMPYTRRYRK